MANDVLAQATTALNQFVTLSRAVTDDDLDKQTPCSEWTVAELLGHVHAATKNFTLIAQSQEPDWSGAAPDVDDRLDGIAQDAATLADAWAADPSAGEKAGMAVPEYALHAWDLTMALGRSSDELDQDVAEAALGFMQAELKPDSRAPMFGPEQEASAEANAADRLAAFAGRTVSHVR